MKYEKPEIYKVGSAVTAIQNQTMKGTSPVQDNTHPVQFLSAIAYEADE
jgi:hypothetical protein